MAIQTVCDGCRKVITGRDKRISMSIVVTDHNRCVDDEVNFDACSMKCTRQLLATFVEVVKTKETKETKVPKK